MSFAHELNYLPQGGSKARINRERPSMVNYNSLESARKNLKRPVVAIGNFDGVHRGHQRLVGTAKRQAERIGSDTAVLTFNPHPVEFFKPGGAPFLLCQGSHL